MKWLRKPLKSKIVLLVMRLADMVRVHPNQIESVCCKCQHVVAIYPSGQKVIKRYGANNVDVVCSHCHAPIIAKLAPGVKEEMSQTQWKQ